MGVAGDVPVVLDVNGNGRNDIAVYRPRTDEWWRRGENVELGGGNGGLAFPGAFDTVRGDELVTFSPWYGSWELFSREEGTDWVTWGVNGDVPV